MADEHDMSSKGSMYETIKTEQDGATFILTLHRPQKRNIINKQMRAEVVDALMKVRADASVRAIIVWGGPEVFAAGPTSPRCEDARPCSSFAPSIVCRSVTSGERWPPCCNRPLRPSRALRWVGAANWPWPVICAWPPRQQPSASRRSTWALFLVLGGPSAWHASLA